MFSFTISGHTLSWVHNYVSILFYGTHILSIAPRYLKHKSTQKFIHNIYSSSSYPPKWKQPKNPSTKWINKLCYIHIKEYCSLVKRKKILIYIKAWMDVKDIMLH